MKKQTAQGRGLRFPSAAQRRPVCFSCIDEKCPKTRDQCGFSDIFCGNAAVFAPPHGAGFPPASGEAEGGSSLVLLPQTGVVFT